MFINWTPLLLKIFIIHCIIVQQGLLILMAWGYPGGQGYTHDLARSIDFAISDSTSTVLSTLITKETHIQGRWRVSFYLEVFFEKVKNVRNVDGPGRSEQLIMWDGNRLMKFVCEAWWWWDETEKEETCGQTQLWAMNLRHLIFQLHRKKIIAAIQCFVLWGVMIF